MRGGSDVEQNDSFQCLASRLVAVANEHHAVAIQSRVWNQNFFTLNLHRKDVTNRMSTVVDPCRDSGAQELDWSWAAAVIWAPFIQ